MHPKPRLAYDAPVAWVDLDAEGDIWPCPDCLPWHLEVIRDDDGDVFVREWHAIDCPLLASLLEAAAEDT
jgi:hypothetical protein